MGKYEGRKCVLVGLQIDGGGNGKELLHWTITKLAGNGDRVIAVNVCRDSDLCKTTTMTLIKVMDDYLAAFEGLCRTKKVFLVGRVARGNSIKQVILKEAALFGATAVVVGANKAGTFEVSAPLAKYCAKKLPPTSSLIAVLNGKVVLERKASKSSSPGGEMKQQTVGSVLHQSTGMEPKVVIPSFRSPPPIENSRVSKFMRKEGSVGGGLLLHELDRAIESSDTSSVSALVKNLPEKKLGWPLLARAAASGDVGRGRGPEPRDVPRKMSVVQWAMNLPDRSSSPPAVRSRESGRIKAQGRYRKTASLELLKNVDGVIDSKASCCKWFQYEELQSSTNNFHSENIIGKGGSSEVYKGCLSDGQRVAIKVSKFSTEASNDFFSEINIITSLQHKHIVPLLGICISEQALISVYDYLPNGSLDENIHGAKPPLTWATRYKIAIGLCEALTYLHNGCSRPVVHRDVKSSNILLSDEFEARLSDFGLALWAPKGASFRTQRDIVGTFGYIAPEYFMYGRVGEKIDIYAYGVVLLELVTGKKPINNEMPKGPESLVMWAAPLLERGEVAELLDPNLDCSHEEVQVQRMLLAASLCINRTASIRPTISMVLRLLSEEEESIDAWMDIYYKYQNEQDCQDDEEASGFGSHLGVALLDADGEDSPPTAAGLGRTKSIFWEEYLRERMSRSSSFD